LIEERAAEMSPALFDGYGKTIRAVQMFGMTKYMLTLSHDFYKIIP